MTPKQQQYILHVLLAAISGCRAFILIDSSISLCSTPSSVCTYIGGVSPRRRNDCIFQTWNCVNSKAASGHDWPVQIVENSAILRRTLAFPLGFASAGNWLASCIYVAAKLHIPDSLAHGPRTVAELAEELKVDADALGRLMRSLAGQGPIPGLFIEIFESPLGLPSIPLPSWLRPPPPHSDLQRRYALTPMGALLRDGSVGSMRPWAIFCGEELGRAWSVGLLTAVRTGSPAFGSAQTGGSRNTAASSEAAAEDFWEYMASNPSARETFDASMQALSAYSAAPGEAADRYDWTLGGRASWIVDVGGGTGLLLASILAKYPVCISRPAGYAARPCGCVRLTFVRRERGRQADRQTGRQAGRGRGRKGGREGGRGRGKERPLSLSPSVPPP